MNINLINGESNLLINECIKEIVNNSNNITTFDLIENSIEEVLIEANYVSMFPEEKKYIIAKNANFFGSDKITDNDLELLTNYLENPNKDTIIIFVCLSKVDTRKKITKIIKDKYNLVIIPNLKSYEIENRVMTTFQKNGFKIDVETVKYIVSNSLNNYDLIMMEVDKIMLYYDKPTNIAHKDAISLVSKSINTNNFLFVDAIIDNNLELSLSLLKDLKVMKVEPIMIFSLIARDIRIMKQVKTLLEQNISQASILKELNLQDWQLQKYIKKVFPYKIKELDNILIKLSDIDTNIKKGKIDKYIALELFILDMC